MEKYIGLDVHATSCTAAVVNGQVHVDSRAATPGLKIHDRQHRSVEAMRAPGAPREAVLAKERRQRSLQPGVESELGGHVCLWTGVVGA